MLSHLLAGTREVDRTLEWSYLRAVLQRLDLTWRDDVLTACELAGAAHLRAALSEGKGAIMVFCHNGMYLSLFPALSRAGLPVTVTPVGMNAYGAEARTFKEIRAVRHRMVIESAGTTALPAVGSFPQMRDTLTSGGSVAIAFDLPGSSRATFIGRERWFASGAVRLAIETGAPLLPISVQQDGASRLVARIEEPVDRVHYVDREHLVRALAQRMEPHILGNPAGEEVPAFHLSTVAPEGAGRAILGQPPIAKTEAQ